MNYKQIALVAGLCCLAFGNLNAQSSQINPAKKLIDMLVGKWQITKINDGNKNTQVSSHPQAMQNIEFTREAKFIVRTNAITVDSGLFRTNEDHKLIYLESINHRETPAEWKVDLKKNMLILSQKEMPKSNIQRYFYVRQSSLDNMVKKENDRR